MQEILASPSDDVITDYVPEDVLDSECPYPELKSSLIDAFHSLSERYQSRLQSLRDKLHQTDRWAVGWKVCLFPTF